MTKLHETEYLFLRDEIIATSNHIQKLAEILYISVAAALLFGLTNQEVLLFLLPPLMIIPLLHLEKLKRNDLCRLGTYLSTFLEGDGFNWETRLIAYDQNVEIFLKNKNPGECLEGDSTKNAYYLAHIREETTRLFSPYTFINIISFILFFIFLGLPADWNIAYLGRLIAAIVVAIISFRFIYNSNTRHHGYLSTKEYYLKCWQYIKEQEELHNKSKITS